MHASSLTENNLLLFGPQIPQLVPSQIADLRRTISEEPELEFLKRIVRELPSLWSNSIQPSWARFGRLDAVGNQLQKLGVLLESEREVNVGSRARNVLLVPLTIITQIAEYVRHRRRGYVEGFCAGFLSAAAVASSQSMADLEKWTATAIRLGVCIGAIVDLDEQERSQTQPDPPGYSSTYSFRWATCSIRWTTVSEKEHLERILASFHEVGGPPHFDFAAAYQYCL